MVLQHCSKQVCQHWRGRDTVSFGNKPCQDIAEFELPLTGADFDIQSEFRAKTFLGDNFH